MVRLGDVCEISSSKANLTDDKIWLLNLDMVEQQTGKIISYYYVNKNELNGSITQFDTENILYSKLRPNLNKVVVPDRNGFSTSELLPLKPNSKILCREYLALYLRSDSFVSWAISKTAGAKMPRLGTKALLDKEIPLPPLDEQRRIAATLDKVTDLISKRRQQLDKLDELVKARFVEMFGDPVSNPHKWQKVALSNLADIRIGPFGSLLHKDDYITGGHPLVNPSHIFDGKIRVDEKLTISDEKYTEMEPYHLKVGDVVMGRRGEMGRCAVVQCPGLLCGTGSLIIRTKGNVRPDYIQKIVSFPTFKKTIEDMAVGQTMPNLNVSIVADFQIIKPPMDVQNRYYNFVEQTEKVKTSIKCSLEKLETLKKALMQKYFGVI